MFDKILRYLLNECFKRVEPYRFTYGRALSPMRTELLCLKRNHARDEIRLSHMYEAWQLTHQYYFSAAPRLLPDPIVRLELKQRTREKHIAAIVAKLARDGKVKAPKQTAPGIA
jgi:hypothetical protein